MPSLARAYGGPVEALIGYVVAGQLAGVASAIVGPQTTEDELRWLEDAVGDADVTQAGPPAGGLWRSGGAVVECAAERMGRAEVVHVHGLLNPISSGAARAAINRGIPVVIGPFGTMSRYTFAHRRTVAKRMYFRAVDAPNLRRAAGLHFTTPAEREEAKWHGIDFGTRAHVVPPPYRGARASDHRPAATASPSVLFLGRLHPVKGVDVLLDAWPAIRATHPGARLTIAGQGTPQYEAELRSRAASLGADAASVVFPGFVRGADKVAHLAAAQVCVLPSLHENFGISVLDSVAAGVPIIVTPGVQLAPWVGRREAGVVAERSAGAVADAVGRVLDDAVLRERVARCGAAVVEADFAPRAVAPALRAMYDAVLAQGARMEQAKE
jgi:glycosyltransferase involved in cell wall biosynthesis